MSLIATYLDDINASYPSNLDRDELRITNDGLLTAVLAMTTSSRSILSPRLRQEAEEMSNLREIDVPVRKKGNVTINNTRSCVIGGGQSETDTVRLVWKTASADILMVPSQYGKNQIGYIDDLNQKIEEMVEAFKIEIENDLDTLMDANKSQVYGSSLVGTEYPLVGDAIQVTTAQMDFFFGDISPINFADDFAQPLNKVIASHVAMRYVERYINQGGGNATNTGYQFSGKDYTFSNRVTNGAGKNATGYWMPDGSLGLLTRVDADAKMGHKAGDGSEWSTETLPGLPFAVGVLHKSQCSDQSALETAGLEKLTATKIEHFQFSFDYATVAPYNSDISTNPSSIRKFEIIPTP